MSFWAADPITLELLSWLGLTAQPKRTTTKAGSAVQFQRSPISRQPTAALPVNAFGTFAEGIMPGDGNANPDIGTGTHGISTEGLTAAGYASQIGQAAQSSLSIIGTFMSALAVPIGIVAQAAKTAVALGLKAMGLGIKGAELAEPGSPAAADLAAQADAQAAFAADNPFTATVLGFFGIHAVAQPTAEALALAAENAHTAAVEASLGITGPGQGFAYSGSPTGFVNARGETLDITGPKGAVDLEIEPNEFEAAAAVAAAAAAQAEADAAAAAADAAASAAAANAAAGQANAATAADNPDGGGGGGGTGGDGSGGSGDGGGASP